MDSARAGGRRFERAGRRGAARHRPLELGARAQPPCGDAAVRHHRELVQAGTRAHGGQHVAHARRRELAEPQDAQVRQGAERSSESDGVRLGLGVLAFDITSRVQAHDTRAAAAR